ncbi:olfactory receptor 1G1-like [Bombina bombina]|uniref:olfactory receptor 1G1-like n=1 Tax=Bombina bombina TaxID=8345 RepID=UPI00235B2329|nr:olfactory receptor 1G1-like [Bombina bombina]
MQNQTILFEYILYGFSDLPSFQLPLFLTFLLIYLMTLAWNLLIILLTITDVHLHTPMYFFLGNLACLDMCCSSVIAPRMLLDLYLQERRISKSLCISQVFFFIFFAIIEVFLLATMSCDRYVAICHPLHYMHIMHWKLCVQLALGIWALGLIYALVHTLCILRLTFCGSVTIHSFFCDLPQLFQLSCNDTFVNVLLIFILGIVLGLGSLVVAFVPYITIFSTVLKIPAKNTKCKAFSTCTSHLSVVLIFYGTLIFNYFRPNTSFNFSEDRLISVCYTLMTPLFNPLIYSLRNQELRSALQRALHNINIIADFIHTTK